MKSGSPSASRCWHRAGGLLERGAAPSPSAPRRRPPARRRPGRRRRRGRSPIYGAASLKAALDKAKAAYEAANPGTTLTVSTDSSSALETQIEQGAPADVFLSADTTNPKKLVDRGLADGDAVPFAGNKLTIVVPTANPAGITSPKDLANPGSRSSPPVTPSRSPSTRRSSWATSPRRPAIRPTSSPSTPPTSRPRRTTSRPLVVQDRARRGRRRHRLRDRCRASDKVTTIDVPDTANVPAAYDGVVVKASQNPVAAKAFLDWIAGPDGQAILTDLGFLPPTS